MGKKRFRKVLTGEPEDSIRVLWILSLASLIAAIIGIGENLASYCLWAIFGIILMSTLVSIGHNNEHAYYEEIMEENK